MEWWEWEKRGDNGTIAIDAVEILLCQELEHSKKKGERSVERAKCSCIAPGLP